MEPPHLSSALSSLEHKILNTKDINELVKTLFIYAKLVIDTQRAYSWTDRDEIGQMIYSSFLPGQWRGLIKINVHEVDFPPYIHFKNEEIDEQSKAEVDSKVPDEVKIIRNMSGWFELLSLHPDDPEEYEYWKVIEEVVDEAFEKYLSAEDKDEYQKIYNNIF